MKLTPMRGEAGLSGWCVEPEDLDAYFEHMARHWDFWARAWYWFTPPVKERIAYTHVVGTNIVVPVPIFLLLVRRGDVIRHMRQVDSFGPNGIPVFEGSGEFMDPKTEREALEFLEWKDVPREVNHRVILTVDDIPKTRERRNEWRLGESEIVEA